MTAALDPWAALADMLGVDATVDASLPPEQLAEAELRRRVAIASRVEHAKREAEAEQRLTRNEAQIALLLEVLGALNDLAADCPVARRPAAQFSRIWCNEARHALRKWRDARDANERARVRPTRAIAEQLVTKLRARADALGRRHYKQARGLRMAAAIVLREVL